MIVIIYHVLYYTITGLDVNRKYIVRVLAVNSDGHVNKGAETFRPVAPKQPVDTEQNSRGRATHSLTRATRSLTRCKKVL